jgi:hypothetical protein
LCSVTAFRLAFEDAIQRAQIDAFTNLRAELEICRDIANGFKHHTIYKPSIDTEFAIVYSSIPSNIKVDGNGCR